MEEHQIWTNLSWVIMPDHVHILVRLGQGRSLSSGVGSFKKFTSRRFTEVMGKKPFWQDGFHDQRLRSWPGVLRKLRYIHQNPVVAGLVTDQEYRWWYCSEDYRERFLKSLPRLLNRYSASGEASH
jgi:REP element-mobilizing transposase RayT